jgi:hypothetical protein
MKRIIVVLEALDYSYLMEVNPPNIMQLEVHPAVSYGLGSRPASGGLLGGMLPICQIPMCYHRTIEVNWCNPFFLTIMREKTEKQFFLCSNGWSIELMLPWMDQEQRALNLKWVEFRTEEMPAHSMVDYLLREKNKYNSYFAYVHLFETHYPFHSPKKKNDRREALLYVDGEVGRILRECSDAEIVLCSDHNLPPQIVSAAFDVPSPKTMLSFIATNFKETQKTYEGDHLEFAKQKWTAPTR